MAENITGAALGIVGAAGAFLLFQGNYAALAAVFGHHHSAEWRSVVVMGLVFLDSLLVFVLGVIYLVLDSAR